MKNANPLANTKSSRRRFGRSTIEKFELCERGRLGPSWRFQCASTIDVCERRRIAECYSPLLLEIAKYLTLKAQGPQGFDRAKERFPQFFAAEELNQDPTTTRRLMLMVLGGISQEEMADQSGIDISTLQHWESLLFDVRGQQASVDWLTQHVFEKERRAGNIELAREMKLATAAGRPAVILILDSDVEAPLDEADRLLRCRIKLHMKIEALADTQVTSAREGVQLMKMHGQLIYEERRLNLAYTKLEARCIESLRRYNLAMERLRIAEKQASDRAARHQGHHGNSSTRRQKSPGERPTQYDKTQQVQLAAHCREIAVPLANLRWGASEEPVIYSLDNRRGETGVTLEPPSAAQRPVSRTKPEKSRSRTAAS